MSRFPLLPLLLSFSTTLQSACLQDKCSVQPFKDNDAECSSNSDMTKSANLGTTLQYSFTLTGSKKRVDSVGMIDIKKNNTDGSIEIGQVGAIIADHVNHKIRVILQTIKTEAGAPVSSTPNMNNPETDSTFMATDQVDSASFSRGGVIYFTKKPASGTVSEHAVMLFVPWFPFNKQIEIIDTNSNANYFSLSSDVDNRIHSVITVNSGSRNLTASGNLLFYGNSLIKDSQNYSDRYRVLVGNIDNSQEPELVTWDAGGKDPVLFKYEQDGFVPHKFSAPILDKCQDVICPAALGDLNQDGTSDLIIADKLGINIYYSSGSIDNPFPMVHQVIPVPENTPVQAIAVSIPNGDDPPKLVWATSTFVPTTEKSPTGTNTITINVLPIKK